MAYRVYDSFCNGVDNKFNYGNINWLLVEEGMRMYYIQYDAPNSPQKSEDDFLTALGLSETVEELCSLLDVHRVKFIAKTRFKPFETHSWNMGYCNGCRVTDKNHWLSTVI